MQDFAHAHTHFEKIAGRAASRLALSLGLTLAFVAVEAVAGIFANSLALLTDAAHNLTDVLALGLSWVAVRLADQPSNARNTYGYHRAGILVALVNATTLVVIALGIFYEAWQRFATPSGVRSGILIGVGILALIVNLATALLVKRGSEQDLNMHSAFIHLLGDVLSTLGAVIAGVLILFTGWNWLDPLASVFIGALILWSAWGILREAVDILLEATPHDVNMKEMVRDITALEGVYGVHDLHVWSISRNLRTMSAHIVTANISIREGVAIQARVNDLVDQRYHIGHATLQLECEECAPDLLYCDMQEMEFLHAHVKEKL